MVRERLKGISDGMGLATHFQNISQSRKNGIFVLKTDEKEVQILFFDGKLIYAESDVKNRDEAISSFLIESRVIDSKTKKKLLKRKREKGKVSILSVLLEEKPDAEEEVRKALRARTQEILCEVIMADRVQFEFIEKSRTEIGFNSKIFRPIGIESIVFDIFKIIDEYKSAQEETKNFNAVPLLQGDFDEVMAETTGVPLWLKDYIDGESSILEIARASKITIYEAIYYISRLLKSGIIVLEKTKEPILDEERGTRIFRALLRHIWTYIFLLLLAGISYLGVISNYFKEETVVIISSDPIDEIATQKQLLKIKTALEAFRILENKYPQSLELLTKGGFIEKKDLTFPSNKIYYYKLHEDGKGYELGS